MDESDYAEMVAQKGKHCNASSRKDCTGKGLSLIDGQKLGTLTYPGLRLSAAASQFFYHSHKSHENDVAILATGWIYQVWLLRF